MPSNTEDPAAGDEAAFDWGGIVEATRAWRVNSIHREKHRAVEAWRQRPVVAGCPVYVDE